MFFGVLSRAIRVQRTLYGPPFTEEEINAMGVNEMLDDDWIG